MDPDLLRNQGYNPDEPTIVKLDNYDLILGERATLTPKSDSTVWGMVIAMSENEASKLYSEPSVSDYKSIDVICQDIAGNDIKAAVYILPFNYPISLPTNSNYAKSLHKICKKMSLPSSYCDKIDAITSEIEAVKKD